MNYLNGAKRNRLNSTYLQNARLQTDKVNIDGEVSSHDLYVLNRVNTP